MRLCCLCLGSLVHFGFLPLVEESSLADIGLSWWDPRRTLPSGPVFLRTEWEAGEEAEGRDSFEHA